MNKNLSTLYLLAILFAHAYGATSDWTAAAGAWKTAPVEFAKKDVAADYAFINGDITPISNGGNVMMLSSYKPEGSDDQALIRRVLNSDGTVNGADTPVVVSFSTDEEATEPTSAYGLDGTSYSAQIVGTDLSLYRLKSDESTATKVSAATLDKEGYALGSMYVAGGKLFLFLYHVEDKKVYGVVINADDLKTVGDKFVILSDFDSQTVSLGSCVIYGGEKLYCTYSNTEDAETTRYGLDIDFTEGKVGAASQIFDNTISVRGLARVSDYVAIMGYMSEDRKLVWKKSTDTAATEVTLKTIPDDQSLSYNLFSYGGNGVLVFYSKAVDDDTTSYSYEAFNLEDGKSTVAETTYFTRGDDYTSGPEIFSYGNKANIGALLTKATRDDQGVTEVESVSFGTLLNDTYGALLKTFFSVAALVIAAIFAF